MSHVNQSKAYLLALITVLFWSTVATAFKIALQEMNYIQVLLIANSVALATYSIILLARSRRLSLLSLSGNSIALSALQGFLNPFAYYLIIFKVYSLLPAQIAQPANFIWPVVLMLLSAPLLKQPVQLNGFVAIIISFTGVLILSSQGNLLHYQVKEPAGIALALFSSVIWSVFWIINLKDRRDDVTKLFMSALFSLVFIFLLALATGNLSGYKTKSLFAAIYIGLFEMGITFVLWLKALSISESTGSVSNLVYLTPFVSLIFISTILGEKIYFTSLIGLCLIVGGILIHRIKKVPW